jgi:hypothetical protein
MYCLTVLEALSLSSRYQQGHTPSEGIAEGPVASLSPSSLWFRWQFLLTVLGCHMHPNPNLCMMLLSLPAHLSPNSPHFIMIGVLVNLDWVKKCLGNYHTPLRVSVRQFDPEDSDPTNGLIPWWIHMTALKVKRRWGLEEEVGHWGLSRAVTWPSPLSVFFFLAPMRASVLHHALPTMMDSHLWNHEPK